MTRRDEIESLLQERRLFPPPPIVAGAEVPSLDHYRAMHRRSLDDPEGFWADAAQRYDWFSPWSRVLDWRPPDAKWFVGATTNICHNCVDRHVAAGRGDDTAIIWEGEPVGPAGPEVRRLSYDDVRRETARLGHALRSLGVKKGDIVTIYMPMVPELAIAMLACARIGAAHSVIFGGFSAAAIADRVADARSRVVITADGGWRRGKVVPLKENVDAACAQVKSVEHVVVLERCANPITFHESRDHRWRDLVQSAPDDGPCEPMDAEALLFVLYTSGTTGKPKGIMHSTGGYMVQAGETARIVFDLRPRRGDVFWCTADCGWVTGHSYVVYGAMATGTPTLMYEGAPDTPTPARFWQIIQRHKVTQFYTAPTAIRAFMRLGEQHPASADLSSLRVLGTVGEPINPEAWMWYHRVIGAERCPIVDTWWQTETGGHMITPLPGATPTKPGSCTLPFFGVDAAIENEQGEELPANHGGLLAIRRPWPGMLRGVLNDRDRFVQTYWSRIRAKDGTPHYFAGDGARRDEDGYFWIMGRVDDVINVSGHRLGTMEVESALVSHPAVAEAAVVSMPHEIKGAGIAAFVTLRDDAGVEPDDAFREALRRHVAKEIGPIARPDLVRFTRALPKTRSGKIMRRLLKAIAEGREQVGDTTTLEDYSVLARLRESEETERAMTADATDRWNALQAYARDVFGAQDEHLRGLMARAVLAGLPDIAVDASVGRLLRTLCAMTGGGRGAAIALELGALAGYSAIWIARGLRRDPPGRLITLEPNEKHAAFAQRELGAAGVADRVEIRRRPALEEIPRLRTEFGEESLDFVFIDAVKTEYTDYFVALRPMIRRGGLIVADNVLGGSHWVTDPPGSSDYRDAVDRFNRAVASDPWFEASCIPLREGLLVARRMA